MNANQHVDFSDVQIRIRRLDEIGWGSFPIMIGTIRAGTVGASRLRSMSVMAMFHQLRSQLDAQPAPTQEDLAIQ